MVKKSMKSNINKYFCDLCSSNLDNYYRPINSKRHMLVFQCKNCLLLQSFSTKPYKSSPAPSMSFDADRSSVMYTKKLVLPLHQKVFDRFNLNFKSFKFILDIGSNRGDFINFAMNKNSNAIIYAVETRNPLIRQYKKKLNVITFNMRYENFNVSQKFDFIYNVHTLEHMESSINCLKKMKNQLSDFGKIFLSVPNINHSNTNFFEEIFIDPHTYHFTNNSLINCLNHIGFKILNKNIKGNEIQYLLCKKNNASNNQHKNRLLGYFDKKNSLYTYQKDIIQNRKNLKKKSETIKNLIKNKNNILFWGAGRIFDGLIKIGKINNEKNIRVLDKNLYKYFKKIHGFKLIQKKDLKLTEKNTVLVICSRYYLKEIMHEAKKYKFKETLTITL